MALEGTFKDFGLADILQLIGLQKKTGVLTVRGAEKQVVTVSFEKGMVVFADEHQRTESERLGHLFVKTKLITPEDLAQAVATQERTMQRLGHILVNSKHITHSQLSQALQGQMKETIYRLFRWQEGRYHFSPEPVSYDREIYVPVSSEFLLMEGIRMIDEWPIIEKKITSYQLVCEKVPDMTPVHPPVKEEGPQEEAWDDMLSIVEEVGESVETSGARSEPGQPVQSANEGAIYRLVDGKRTVQELIDVGRIGEFETCKILYGFLSLNLIRVREEVKASVDREAVPRRRVWPWGDLWIVAAFGAALFAALLFNPWSFFSLGYRVQQGREGIAEFRDEIKLKSLHRALKVFYLEKQTYPLSLEKMEEDGLLRAAGIRDHRGDLFDYRGGENEYHLGKVGKE
jgi:hypothetical protein